jgi:hypothetical protein
MLTGKEIIEAARKMTPYEKRAQVIAAEFICRRGGYCPALTLIKGVKNASSKRRS